MIMRESHQVQLGDDGYEEGKNGRESSSFRLRRIIFAVVLMVLMAVLFSSRRAVNVEEIDKRSAVLSAKHDSAPPKDGKPLAMGVRPNIWEKLEDDDRYPELGKFPFVVAIRYYTAEDRHQDLHCTGTLIANNMVLTAAHCLWDSNRDDYHEPNEIQVIAGIVRGDSRSLSRADRTHKAIGRYLRPHPSYLARSRNMYDVGIIVLDSPIRPSEAPAGDPFSHFINNAALPARKGLELPSQRAGQTAHFYSVGFGEDQDGENWYRLRYDESTNIPGGDDACKKLYPKEWSVGSICIKNQRDNNKGVICSGDSGGPLVLAGTNQVWGVGVVGKYSRKGTCLPLMAMYEGVSHYMPFVAAQKAANPPFA